MINIDNMSIQMLDVEIRHRFERLKSFSALQLGLHVPPVQLAMLETLYSLKLYALEGEADSELSKFDSSLIYSPLKPENNGLQKLKLKISKLKSGLKSRSKSPCSKTTSEQHKNYFLLERENLERKFEYRAKEIQLEVLNSLDDIEVQLMQQKEQLERTLATIDTNSHHGRYRYGHSSSAACNSIQQLIMDKRTRRSRRLSSHYCHLPSSPPQYNHPNFESAMFHGSYRNPHVCETDV